MGVKIDDKTYIPVGWLFASFITIMSMTTIGAFWVSSVDYRLSRIEGKLSIPPLVSIDVINKAIAGEKNVNRE